MKIESSRPTESGETRRSFIRKTATLAAAVSTSTLLKTPVYGQNQAPSANVTGANNRIAVGYIGCGGRGMAHVGSQKQHAHENNIVQAAVCDLYTKHLNVGLKTIGLADANGYTDHRKLLERKDIDAVIISTVDDWHAQCSIDAAEAGKHVFCEKPMTRYLGEAWDVYDVVKKSGKTYCIGSQGCMDVKWLKSAEWVKAGKIGKLAWGQTSYCRRFKPSGEWNYPVDPDANEKNLDWYRWLGKARKIPFDPKRYFSWHLYYDYNSGIIGNLLPHRFHTLVLATGTPEYPRRVVCTGTRKIFPEREITDTTHLLSEYPNGLTLVAAGSTVNGVGLPDMLRGNKATLYYASQGNRIELKPEPLFTDEMDVQDFSDPAPTEDTARLEKNFFDCIRSGQQTVANLELAIRVQTTLCMAEMSERLGLALFYNEKKRSLETGDGKPIEPISYDTVIPAPPV
jgi:predicted dehydrogenase